MRFYIFLLDIFKCDLTKPLKGVFQTYSLMCKIYRTVSLVLQLTQLQSGLALHPL